MDSNQLRQFLAVAELEHVTNAAKRLNIAQPALTRSLHKMEQELGVKLFVREGRNIRLTQEGAFLRDRTAPVIAELDRAEAQVRSFAKKESLTVNLCIRSASVLAVDAIAAFAREHPEASFRVTQDEEAEANDLVISSSHKPPAPARIGGHAALPARGPEGARSTEGGPAVKGGSTEGGPAGSRFSAAFVERIGVAIPATQVRALAKGAKTVPLESLEQARFIGLAGSQSFRALCESLCAASGFTPDVAFESDNPSVVRKMIALGLGVGFWPERSWGPVDTDAVVWKPVRGAQFQRTVTVGLTSRGVEKELARLLQERMVDAFAQAWRAPDAQETDDASCEGAQEGSGADGR